MDEDDVRYGIADCRRRLRTQRATLRTHHPPTDVTIMLEPGVSRSDLPEEYAEREEAVRT